LPQRALLFDDVCSANVSVLPRDKRIVLPVGPCLVRLADRLAMGLELFLLKSLNRENAPNFSNLLV